MCVYCMIADWIHQYTPDPYYPTPSIPISPLPYSPVIPLQPPPQKPWTQEQLDQILDILRRVKEMEDALGGCPCEEPGKMDFLKDIQTRLDRIEEASQGKPHDENCPNAGKTPTCDCKPTAG